MISPRADPLLARSRLRAHIAFRGAACRRWAITGPQSGRLAFHAILSGECWAHVHDRCEPVRMATGGLLVYRPSAQHMLTHARVAQSAEPPALIAPLSVPLADPHVGLLCGFFHGGGGAADEALLGAIPDYVLWPSASDCPQPIAALMPALAICAREEAPGSEIILQRVCELLILMVLQRQDGVASGRGNVLRAQCDPALRRVLSLMHGRPGRRWTVRSMAAVAGLSRSKFAAIFRQEVGQAPMRYLRHYRLAAAARRLEEGNLSFDRAARNAGYRSTDAFRRSLRRSLPGASHLSSQ